MSLAFVSLKGVALFAIKQSVAAVAFTSSKLPAGAVAELSAPLARRCSSACNPVPAPGGVLRRGSSTCGPSGVEGMGNNWGSKISTLSLVSVNERVRFN